MPDLDALSSARLGEPLDHGLRPVEVAVVFAIRRARHIRGIDPVEQRLQILWLEQTRTDPELVLKRDVRGQRCTPLGRVGEEDVTARLEDGASRNTEAFGELVVEGRRLTCEEAVDASTPLLANPTWLDARGLGADAGPLVNHDLGARSGEVEGDGKTRDAGTDDCNLHREPEISR